MRPGTFTTTPALARSAPDFRRLRQLQIQQKGILTRVTPTAVASSPVLVRRVGPDGRTVEEVVVSLAEVLQEAQRSNVGLREALELMEDQLTEMQQVGARTAEGLVVGQKVQALVSRLLEEAERLTPAELRTVVKAGEIPGVLTKDPRDHGIFIVAIKEEVRAEEARWVRFLAAAAGEDTLTPIFSLGGRKVQLARFFADDDALGIGAVTRRTFRGDDAVPFIEEEFEAFRDTWIRGGPNPTAPVVSPATARVIRASVDDGTLKPWILGAAGLEVKEAEEEPLPALVAEAEEEAVPAPATFPAEVIGGLGALGGDPGEEPEVPALVPLPGEGLL